MKFIILKHAVGTATGVVGQISASLEAEALDKTIFCKEPLFISRPLQATVFSTEF